MRMKNREEEQKHFKELCMKNAKTKKYFASSRSLSSILALFHSLPVAFMQRVGSWFRRGSEEMSFVMLLTVCLQNYAAA